VAIRMKAEQNRNICWTKTLSQR